MRGPAPIPSDVPGATLLGDLLRSQLPVDEDDFPREFRDASAKDLILADLPQSTMDTAVPEPRQTITDVDSSPSLLDEGPEVRKTSQ